MLVLSRNVDESVLLEVPEGSGPLTIRVMPCGWNRRQIMLGFEAPSCVRILRQELVEAVHIEEG